MAEKERVDAYLNVISRLEPDIAMIDHDAGIASIAISLKRIADAVTFEARLRAGLAEGLGVGAAVIVIILIYKAVHWVLAWPV